MGSLSFLTSSEIQAIAGALAGGGAQATTMQVPSGQQIFAYAPSVSPVKNGNAASAMPIGVGSVATGGDNVKVQVDIGKFDGPVDVYVAIYGPSAAGIFDSFDIYNLQDNTFVSVVDEMLPWKTGVTDVNSVIIDVPTIQFPSGPYVLLLTVTPAGTQDSYYRWVTNFVIP